MLKPILLEYFNYIKMFDIIELVVCNAPANAFILNVNGHNGYNSCNSCITKGSFINNIMCFDEIDAPLRTNESFRLKKDDGLSPLEDLPINITSSVVLDYMHNVCLGVVKSAIRIVLSKETCLTLNGQAKCLLIQSVTKYSDLYGVEFISYNVHELIHFPDFVLVHGPLDQFRAFKYENCLQNLF
ncbi:unnamed protein product [Macrosiphum euphorbiae]|uniref:Uncharacterized protein n=1 Tax=Macrosiphum euphorbiae TaxID=13131 RepID=A0AAV0WFX3_9HEMI|nr:unnamed protein product [Macrosiphum euphorbiae]